MAHALGVPRSQRRGSAIRGQLGRGIIKALDREGLSVRGAHSHTGIAADDFSRIRNADLGRRLGSRVEVKVKVRRVENASFRQAISH